MKKIILIIITTVAIARTGYGQISLYSWEAEYQNATFDPAQGLALRINHAWKKSPARVFQSGLMLNYLVRPGVSPYTTGDLTENYSVSQLQFHTGYEWFAGKRKRFFTFLGGYVGMRGYRVSGRLSQDNQGFEREYVQNTLLGDIGFRFGLGYQVHPRVGVRLSFTSSLIEVAHPLGFWTGLLFWSPDSLALAGLGITWRIKA